MALRVLGSHVLVFLLLGLWWNNQSQQSRLLLPLLLGWFLQGGQKLEKQVSVPSELRETAELMLWVNWEECRGACMAHLKILRCSDPSLEVWEPPVPVRAAAFQVGRLHHSFLLKLACESVCRVIRDTC